MLRPLALGVATLAATAGIAFAAAPAFAATDAPVAGSAECTAAVNGTTSVTTAKTALNSAKETQQDLTNQLAAAKVAVPFHQDVVDTLTAQLNSQAVTVATAQRAYDRAVAQATRAICTGSTPSTVTPAPTPDPTSPPVVPHTRSEAVIDGEIDALSCTSSNADLQTIDRHIAARQVAHQTTAEVVARLNAKLASLNCTSGAVTPKAAAQTAKDCGCVTVTQAPVVTSSIVTPKTVVPTQDNGSVANSSSAADVPAGSVQTGAE